MHYWRAHRVLAAENPLTTCENKLQKISLKHLDKFLLQNDFLPRKRATEFHISHNKSLPENEESPNLGQVAALELSPLRNSDHTCLLSISLGFPFGQDRWEYKGLVGQA